jgi:branched-chain amino acid transport system substrate-binding protein
MPGEKMFKKRSFLAMVLFATTLAAPTVADDMPGVTATEIKIGNTDACSGPASAYGVIGKVESQIVGLQGAGANVLLVAAIPKFAAQAIRKVHDLEWNPLFFMTNNSVSIGAVIKPAGPENAIGMITALYMKDPTDPAWKNDAGMNEWRDFMAKDMPGTDTTDLIPVFAYAVSKAMLQVLKQCGDDFSRENIMKQAANLHDLELSTLLPGIKLNTSPTNYHPLRQMQLAKFDGTHWVRFGDVITGAGD